MDEESEVFFMGRISKDDLILYLIKKHHKLFDKEISRIKIQKALYFLFAFYGANISLLNLGPEEEQNTPYLFDANFEAWSYGPVDRDVYFKFKSGNYDASEFSIEQFLNGIDEYTRGYLEDMTTRIFNTSDFGLVNLSHEDECWKEKFDRERPQASNEILNDSIIEEYAKKELN